MKLVRWFTIWAISISAFRTKISVHSNWPFLRTSLWKGTVVNINSVRWTRLQISTSTEYYAENRKKKALCSVLYSCHEGLTICGNLMYASWPFHTLRSSVQMHCTYLTLITIYTLFWQQNSSCHKTGIDRF